MKIETALQGSRIQIRDYRKSDLEFLTDMWFDAENGAYLSDPARAYVDETYQHALDTLEDSPHGYYLVIELADTGETIGSCCMFPDETRKVYDIGYCIHKRHWKQGYGSETISLLLRWMQEQGAEKRPQRWPLRTPLPTPCFENSALKLRNGPNSKSTIWRCALTAISMPRPFHERGPVRKNPPRVRLSMM